MTQKHTPLDRLRHHVTGAIERGEKTAITAAPAAGNMVELVLQRNTYKEQRDELLAALEELQQALDGDDASRKHAAKANARAAIAKAKGGV